MAVGKCLLNAEITISSFKLANSFSRLGKALAKEEM